MNTSPPNPFRPLRFRLYVDESGDHAYSRLDQTPHRYLALLGVWFEQPTKYTQFHDALESLKRSIWGPRPDSPVVLHRSDIINRKGPFGIFKDPSLRDRFDNELLRIIKDAEFKMMCVVIDKKSHRDQYADPYHPYHYAMAAMLERYAGWLNYFNRVGDIMAESRGGEEDIQLKEAYARFYNSGTRFLNREIAQRVLTSGKIKLEKKHEIISGLELADILAHPIKIHCLHNRHLVEKLPVEFGKKLIEIGLTKFNRHVYQDRIDGYGRVYLACQ